jgi:hypothetical protein
VAEVAETADGMTVITYEIALPDGDKATSAVKSMSVRKTITRRFWRSSRQ